MGRPISIIFGFLLYFITQPVHNRILSLQIRDLINMKVHFMGDPNGNKDIYGHIIDKIKSLHHQIVTEHILSRTQAQVDAESPEESMAYLRMARGWIRLADVVVYEASIPSFSLGYEIAIASTQYRTHVIMLYKSEYAKSNPALNAFRGVGPETIQFVPFNDDNLTRELKRALREATGYIDKRFNMMIPKSLRNYLDWAAGGPGAASGYVRQLIEEDKLHHPEYEELF